MSPLLPPTYTPPPLPSSSHTVPKAPEGLVLRMPDAATAPQLSQDAQVAMWRDRIRTMANSVLVYEHFHTLTEECNTATNVIASDFFRSLPEHDRTRLYSQADTLTSRRNKAQAELSLKQEYINHSASWPIAPVLPSADETERYWDIVKDVIDLRDSVAMLKHALDALNTNPDDTTTTTPEPPALPQLFLVDNYSDDEDGYPFSMRRASDMAMDINSHSPINRSRKRARSITNDDNHNIPAPEDDTPSPEELKELQATLTGYQTRLENLRNQSEQYDADQRESLREELEARTRKRQHQYAREDRVCAKEREREDAPRQAAMRDMEVRLVRDEEDVAMISADTTDMRDTMEQLQEELRREVQARDASYQRLLEVEKKMQSYTDDANTTASTLAALKSTLEAYTAASAQLPPPPPTIPPISYILQAFEQPMLDSLRETLKPAIEDLRENVQQLLLEKNRQVFAKVWSSVEQTLKMLEFIQERLARSEGVLIQQ
ncbi:hypothetical protein BDN70DRAFT_882911 [Pholiota conissans]|uniref:Uncharacterized protein n=1 Tax=Pholiota conissans TaxID=109636 RepID=A0A9P6CX99_9AGAR|nr:hypothetical protein BDN70DRAFT_882911 [Pholiota conissans]